MAQPDPGSFAANARREAHQILSGPQYLSHPQKTFDPLGGVVHTIGHWLGDIFDPPARWIWHHLLHSLFGHFSSAFGSLWPLVAGAVLLLVGMVVGRYMIRRRQRIDAVSGEPFPFSAPEDPDTLDGLAANAERDEDWQRAIRLRFRAGVVRLDRLGAIDRGFTKTTRQISAALGSPDFDSLASDLESIVYGGVDATAGQAANAKQGWPLVISQAARSAGSRARAA